MDNQFKVPKIPKVSANNNLITSAVRPKLTTGRKSGKSTVVAPKVVKAPVELSPAPPGPLIPKFCPACSKILIEYLSPIETYLKDILLLADDSVLNRPVGKKPARDVVQPNLTTIAAKSSQINAQPSKTHSNLPISSQVSESNASSNQTRFQESSQTSKYDYDTNSKSLSNRQTSNGDRSQRANATSQATHASTHQSAESISNGPSDRSHPTQKQWVENHNSKVQSHHSVSSGDEYTKSQVSDEVTPIGSRHSDCDRPTSEHQSSSSNATYTERRNEQPGTINSAEGQSGSQSSDRSSTSQASASAHHQWTEAIEATDVNHNRTTTELPPPTQLAHTTPVHTEQYGGLISASEPLKPETFELTESPFAYVTIVTSNFSAINAILLANSIFFYNNHYLNVLSEEGQSIKQRYNIPLVVLVCHAIDDELLELLHQIFDQVIKLKPHDAILLNDDSLGIQQLKVHLWKELIHFSKCIFLESSTLVVGQISNLLLEYDELSACVDCFFPDNFNCSVFVFEPSVDTFRQLINYGLHERSTDVSGELDSVDEMTLLNEFFASKWHKLSFIYNFVRNDMTYTQISAYFKFGANVRVVNFGHSIGEAAFSVSSSGERSSSKLNSPQQPWNYKIHVGKAEMQEEPFEDAPVDNYSKFYLRLFMRRVWPLISKKLTPMMLSHYRDQTEWTVAELSKMISLQSGTANSAFDQNTFTLRRKKSWVTTLDQPIQLDPEIDEQSDQVESIETTSDDTSETTLVDLEPLESSEVDSELENLPEISIEEQRELQRQHDQRIKSEWEDGRVDWMNQHQSDKIINRLKTLIRKN